MSNRTRKLYNPRKYYSGLTVKNKLKRSKEINKHSSIDWKKPEAYTKFNTDKGIKTKTSKYTNKWNSTFKHAKSLKQKALATGVPLKYIKQSYNRGMAAWRTGHRPGATQQQWGYARVHSFLLCGKTYHTTDADIVRDAEKNSKTAKNWWSKQNC
jgi:hypothetical protein